jgi:hypothetical protein
MTSIPDPVMEGLTAAKTALEARSDFWGHIMVAATVLVAIGVAIEVWATILEVRDELHEGGKIKWHHILTFIGAIFVAAFVGLECIAEYKGGDIETKLRSNNGAAQLELINRANEAVADAVAITEKFGGLHDFVTAKEGELDDRFAVLKRYAADQRKQTDEVIAELNNNRQKLDKARTDAIAAADEAKEALAAVTAARKPRTLTAEQQKIIARKMATWAKIPNSGARQSVAIFPTNATFESAQLADLIAAALGPEPSGAGWSINRYPVTMGIPMVVSGVGMFTSSNARGQAVAAALAKALNEEGIVAFVVPQKWKGCEDNKITDHPDTDPFCSHVSVMVGDHP